MNQQQIRPLVGVATVVTKEGKILIGKDSKKGSDIYGVPGGHWENGETLKECSIREVKEESGVLCDNIELISVYDFFRKDKNKSYVTIGMKADYVYGKLDDLIEEGRTDWNWHTAEETLKLNLFPADRVLIERFLNGEIYN